MPEKFEPFANMKDLGDFIEDDEPYLSIPLGHAEALEVELTDDGAFYILYYRRWETGPAEFGLLDENDLASIGTHFPDLPRQLVIAFRDYFNEYNEALDAAMAGTLEEEH